MGRKKIKQSEPKEMTAVSHSTEATEGNRIEQLEKKVDKLLDVMAGMDDRVKKQEARADVRDVSPIPSAHSSVRDSNHLLPSFEELRSDEKIQAEVQRRLHQYDNVSRLESRGKVHDFLKSGRYRQGVHRVKKIVHWPQDHCSVPYGSKQPMYDDLNVLQWSQGFIQCVLDESNDKIKENMLKYFVSAMQDSIELSFVTTKRAHGLILQEMEKGSLTWLQADKIEKIRSRNTQRMVPNGSNANVKGQNEGAEKTMLCKLYNKGSCKYQNQTEHTDKGMTYQHFCSNCFASTGKKYEHPRHQCLRLKSDKKHSQSDQKL